MDKNKGTGGTGFYVVNIMRDREREGRGDGRILGILGNENFRVLRDM